MARPTIFARGKNERNKFQGAGEIFARIDDGSRLSNGGREFETKTN
jgi:hypothetical protein